MGVLSPLASLMGHADEGDLTSACPIDDSSGESTPVGDFEVGNLWLYDRMYHVLHLFSMFLPAKCSAKLFRNAYEQCCCCTQQYYLYY